MDHEGDPTVPGGKSLERRKPRRARACVPANPRDTGAASRREKHPEGGFPCSFVASQPEIDYRTFNRLRSTRGATAHLGAPPGNGPPKGRASGLPEMTPQGTRSVRTLPDRKGRQRLTRPPDLCLANRRESSNVLDFGGGCHAGGESDDTRVPGPERGTDLREDQGSAGRDPKGATGTKQGRDGTDRSARLETVRNRTCRQAGDWNLRRD